MIAASAQLLRRLLAELSAPGGRGALSEEEAAQAAQLGERFLEETQEAGEAVGVQDYLRRALHTDEPEHLQGPPAEMPRTDVLDPLCRERV
eukprot:CAMPEP_0195137216 /NCGR_PEP_ID=MMETSP0448-20130528/155561_1 /TAXON_ID=66468 /ORGANISM="Heterocapsa triquestra, Strain CCMP 448" /LENGTH=90 /DNA_ID=CAMNT_0040175429 /DNA_START=1 /DNA_END=270 /DNA_ORIENTATION=-